MLAVAFDEVHENALAACHAGALAMKAEVFVDREGDPIVRAGPKQMQQYAEAR